MIALSGVRSSWLMLEANWVDPAGLP
jgi:hypothetical protein